jgi:hypothetical protein
MRRRTLGRRAAGAKRAPKAKRRSLSEILRRAAESARPAKLEDPHWAGPASGATLQVEPAPKKPDLGRTLRRVGEALGIPLRNPSTLRAPGFAVRRACCGVAPRNLASWAEPCGASRGAAARTLGHRSPKRQGRPARLRAVSKAARSVIGPARPPRLIVDR